MTKEKLMDMIYDWDWMHSYSNHEELADNIRAALDEERKGEVVVKCEDIPHVGWHKEDGHPVFNGKRGELVFRPREER